MTHTYTQNKSFFLPEELPGYRNRRIGRERVRPKFRSSGQRACQTYVALTCVSTNQRPFGTESGRRHRGRNDTECVSGLQRQVKIHVFSRHDGSDIPPKETCRTEVGHRKDGVPKSPSGSLPCRRVDKPVVTLGRESTTTRKPILVAGVPGDTRPKDCTRGRTPGPSPPTSPAGRAG